MNSGLVDYPKGFDQVWSAPGLTIWRPQPPTDYVALGCLVSTDEQPPPLSAVVCVHRKVRQLFLTTAGQGRSVCLLTSWALSR